MRTSRLSLAGLCSAVSIGAAAITYSPLLAADAVESSAAKARAAALDSITIDELKEYVDVLANDTFEGREAGSRGGQAAGNYLRDRFSKAGLKGAGPARAPTRGRRRAR